MCHIGQPHVFGRNTHSDGMDGGGRVATPMMDEDSSCEESRDVDTLAEIRSFQKGEEVETNKKKKNKERRREGRVGPSLRCFARTSSGF